MTFEINGTDPLEDRPRTDNYLDYSDDFDYETVPIERNRSPVTVKESNQKFEVKRSTDSEQVGRITAPADYDWDASAYHPRDGSSITYSGSFTIAGDDD